MARKRYSDEDCLEVVTRDRGAPGVWFDTTRRNLVRDG